MELLQWANTEKNIEIRGNADTPDDAALAKRYGAEGIGLCRTETMFTEQDMGNTFKRMILTDDTNERKLMLLELNIRQKSVFRNILRQMQNLPVALRLLDAPLHEFLPKEEDLISEIEGIMSRPWSRESTESRKGTSTTTSPRAERIQSNAGAPGC